MWETARRKSRSWFHILWEMWETARKDPRGDFESIQRTYIHNSFLTYYSWVEITIENQLTREKCQRIYIQMIKFAFKPCGTLGS